MSDYQLMPQLSEAEYDALKASIAVGYDPAKPVVVDENGAVLDGHHRQRACAELGISPPLVTLPGLTEEQKHDYALRANLACRHLSQSQKRDLIWAELGCNPDRSDREIGRLCGADHKTVGAVRRGEFPHVYLAGFLRSMRRAVGDCTAVNLQLVARAAERLGEEWAIAPPDPETERATWLELLQLLEIRTRMLGADLADGTTPAPRGVPA